MVLEIAELLTKRQLWELLIYVNRCGSQRGR